MYVTDDKIFLHMVKSAGISVHKGLINSEQRVHVNQRHASLNNLPEYYQHLPRYSVIRKPEDWYKSFYQFFLGVQGYLSFMLNDPKDPYDGYIYPIDFNEFVRRSINFKDTLLKFPNKAKVFNNLLRSQGNLHFITGYFTEAIDPENQMSYEQFDMSLYEWFWRGCGADTAINIPMDRLDYVEDLFNIEIGHENKTKDKKIDMDYTDETLALVRETHKEFYDLIDNFDPENPKTYYESLADSNQEIKEIE